MNERTIRFFCFSFFKYLETTNQVIQQKYKTISYTFFLLLPKTVLSTKSNQKQIDL